MHTAWHTEVYEIAQHTEARTTFSASGNICVSVYNIIYMRSVGAMCRVCVARRRIYNGSNGVFQPSLKGRSARQTASTRVQELGIRYMKPFVTSLTDIHSYGTTVHMSIFSRRFMRHVQIMRYSRVARSTGSRCHHAYSTDSYRLR